MDFISTVYSPIHLLDMLLRVVHPIPPFRPAPYIPSPQAPQMAIPAPQRMSAPNGNHIVSAQCTVIAQVVQIFSASKTHRLHITEMRDILLIHGHEIGPRFQVHVQLDDLAEVRSRGLENRCDVLERLGLEGVHGRFTR